MPLSFVCSVIFFFYLCLLCIPSCVRCPLLATFLSLSFCLFSLIVFSERVPGLIWFGFVYLVATAGFVADQLM